MALEISEKTLCEENLFTARQQREPGERSAPMPAPERLAKRQVSGALRPGHDKFHEICAAALHFIRGHFGAARPVLTVEDQREETRAPGADLRREIDRQYPADLVAGLYALRIEAVEKNCAGKRFPRPGERAGMSGNEIGLHHQAEPRIILSRNQRGVLHA